MLDERESSPREHHIASAEVGDRGQVAAAIRIQRFWRQRNKAKAKYLTPHARWNDAIQSARFEVRPSSAGPAREVQAERAPGDELLRRTGG